MKGPLIRHCAYFYCIAALGGSCEVPFLFARPSVFLPASFDHHRYGGPDVSEKRKSSACWTLGEGEKSRSRPRNDDHRGRGDLLMHIVSKPLLFIFRKTHTKLTTMAYVGSRRIRPRHASVEFTTFDKIVHSSVHLCAVGQNCIST